MTAYMGTAMKPQPRTDEEILDYFEATQRVGSLHSVATSLNRLTQRQWGETSLILRHPTDINAFLHRKLSDGIRPQLSVADTLILLSTLHKELQNSDGDRSPLRDKFQRTVPLGLDYQQLEEAHGRGGGVYYQAYHSLVLGGSVSMHMVELGQGTLRDWRIASIIESFRWLQNSHLPLGAMLEFVRWPLFHHAVSLGFISLDAMDTTDLFGQGLYSSTDVELLTSELLTQCREFRGTGGEIRLIHAGEISSPYVAELARLADRAVAEPDSPSMHRVVKEHLETRSENKPLRKLLVKFGCSLGLTDRQIAALWEEYGISDRTNLLQKDGSDCLEEDRLESVRRQVIRYRKQLGLDGRPRGRPKKRSG